MKSSHKIVLAALLVSLLTGCASFKPEPRPSYTGTDQIGAINSDLLVGTWQVQTLNPFKEEPAMDVQMTFNADGSASGYSKIEDGDDSNPFGKMEFEMTGSWSVDGDLINQSVESMEEVSGNPAAKLGAALSLGISKNRTTQVNLYEASANRLVIVNEQEGVAQLFTRVQ